MQETLSHALQPVPSTQASIRGEESEQIELLNIRKETHEEYALSRPRGLREALLIVASFLMFFFCLITPDVFVPWLAGGALLLLGAGLWAILRPRQNPPCGKFIVCAHPVVGDCLAKTIRNRSTIFHSVLSTWSIPHTGSHTLLRISVNKPISISISDRHVVRQGRYLSLHDEVKNFPLQHWLRRDHYRCGLAAGAVYAVILDPAGYAAEIHSLMDERRADH